MDQTTQYRQLKPSVVHGDGKVTADTLYWIVTADKGTSLRFTAAER